MNYLSPFQFVSYDNRHVIYKEELAIARLKLVSDINTSATGSVEYNGNQYTKADINTLFDGFDNMTTKPYHEAIHDDRALSAFLSKSYLEANTVFGNNELYKESGFVDYISLYYSSAYVSCFKQNFEKQDSDVLKNLMWIQPTMQTDEDAATTKTQVEAILAKQKEKLETFCNALESTNTYSDSDILAYHHPKLMQCYNALTDDYVGSRDEYAHSLYTLANLRWNQDRKYSANTIMEDAASLKTSPEVTQMIAEKRTVFQQFKQTQDEASAPDYNNTESGGGTSLWQYFLYAVVIIRLLLTLSKCANNNNSYGSRNYTPPNYSSSEYSSTYGSREGMVVAPDDFGEKKSISTMSKSEAAEFAKMMKTPKASIVMDESVNIFLQSKLDYLNTSDTYTKAECEARSKYCKKISGQCASFQKKYGKNDDIKEVDDYFKKEIEQLSYALIIRNEE